MADVDFVELVESLDDVLEQPSVATVTPDRIAAKSSRLDEIGDVWDILTSGWGC